MPTTTPPASVALLDSALAWTCDCLQRARAVPDDVATPCADWTLGRLLGHLGDSLAVLDEAASLGHVEVGAPVDPAAGRGDVDSLLRQACATRAAWRHRVSSAGLGVGDLRLGRDTLAAVGALEAAVHGWDVAQAAGARPHLPEDLAARLYDVALVVATPGERGRRFGPALPAPDDAPASVRLLAHLGRRAS